MAENGQGSQAGRSRNPLDPARDRPNQPRQPGAPGQGAGQNNNRDDNWGNGGDDGDDEVITLPDEFEYFDSDEDSEDDMSGKNKHYGMRRLATDFGGMTLADDVPMIRVAGTTAQEERQAKNTREASKALRDLSKTNQKSLTDQTFSEWSYSL